MSDVTPEMAAIEPAEQVHALMLIDAWRRLTAMPVVALALAGTEGEPRLKRILIAALAELRRDADGLAGGL